jgi:membrane associated rhomboid family serine protease
MPFDDVKRQGPGRGAYERAINLPPAVLWLIGINVAVHLVRQLLGDSADEQILREFGLVPATYTSGSGEFLSMVLSPITYQFLHGGWLHLAVNMVTLAAFGAPVERLFGSARFVAFYLSAGIVAGLIHVLIFSSSPDPVIGASGAISGVFGAVLMTLRRLGRLNSLLPVAGLWIVLNVVLGLYGDGPGTGGAPVAWTAHIGGFVYGLLAFRLFVPKALRAPPEPDDGDSDADS